MPLSLEHTTAACKCYSALLCGALAQFADESIQGIILGPFFECNSVTWSPVSKKDIVSIEKVQRRFTKRLPGLKNFTYQERLNRLKLVSLEQRRLYMELIMFLK